MLQLELLERRDHPGTLGGLAAAAGLGTLPSVVPDFQAVATDLGYTSERLTEILGMWVAPVQLPFFAGGYSPNGTPLPLGTYSFHAADATWHLTGQQQFAYGGPGWIPVVGDWDGDGVDTIGVVDPATMMWYLKNDNHAGEPSIAPFAFGAPGWRPVTHDWDHTGTDKVGVIDPSGIYHMAVQGGVKTGLHG